MKLSVFSMQRTPGSSPVSQPEAPAPLPDTADIDTRLRLQALERALTITTVLGGLLYLLSLPDLLEARNWPVLAGYGLIVAGIAALTLARRLSYRLRALGFLGLLLVGGAFLLVTQGLAGSGRLLLLLWPLLAVVLIAAGRLSRLALMFFNLLTVTVISLLGLLDLLPITGGTGQSWVLAWLGYSLLVIAGTLVLDQYLHGLRHSLDEREQAILAFDREHQRLRFQLQERTAALEHRLAQTNAGAEITRSIARELDLERLLPNVCELIKSRFDLYFVGIFLIEPGSDQVVLRAGTGEAGLAMLAEGYGVQAGGDTLVGLAAAARQARMALDVDKDVPAPPLAHFTNPYLPDTRSEMALPLISQQAVLGVLSVQSDREAAFDEDDAAVLQGIADSLGSAIENARLFGQIQKNLETISQLHSQYLRRSWMQIIESQGLQEHVYEARSQDQQSKVGAAPPASSLYTLQAPILLREQTIGSLTLESAHAFGEKERALVEAVINQAALALENARLIEETRKRADQETIAASISSKIWSSSNMDTILRTSLEELGVSLEANEGSIELWLEQLTEPGARIEEGPPGEAPHG